MFAPLDKSEDRMFDEAAAAQMERIVIDLKRVYQERNEALREVARAHHEALLRLSLAAEFKDDHTGVHIMRIGYMAEALANMLGQPAAFARMLGRVAPMHDIGKIGIPDHVLKKLGPYDTDDRAIMDLHPAMGAKILGRSRIPLFQLAAEVALGHHERWDGRGYPAQLSDEAIPLSARIVAVVDFFDALTMDRCYRKAFSDDEALRMLIQERGAAFDPQIVDVFVANAPSLIRLRDLITRHPPSFESMVEGD